MNFTLVQGINDMTVDIYAENVDAMRGKGGCSRETDIAKSDDANFLKFHWGSCWKGFIFNGLIIQPLVPKFFTTLTWRFSYLESDSLICCIMK
jgi:hypothetical protein